MEEFTPSEAAKLLQEAEIEMDVERMKPCVPTQVLAEIDVTCNQLENPETNASLATCLRVLREKWVGEFPDRAHDCRVGTVHVFVDEDGHFHLDFRSRFIVNQS